MSLFNTVIDWSDVQSSIKMNSTSSSVCLKRLLTQRSMYVSTLYIGMMTETFMDDDNNENEDDNLNPNDNS